SRRRGRSEFSWISSSISCSLIFGETMRSLMALVLISVLSCAFDSSAVARTFVLSCSPIVYHLARQSPEFRSHWAITEPSSVSDVERITIRWSQDLARECLGGLGARLVNCVFTLPDVDQRERFDAARRRLLPGFVRRHVFGHARVLDVLAQEGA